MSGSINSFVKDAALRDTLLAKLISGEVRVRDAQWNIAGARATTDAHTSVALRAWEGPCR